MVLIVCMNTIEHKCYYNYCPTCNTKTDTFLHQKLYINHQYFSIVMLYKILKLYIMI
jgi:hypothetical protein